MQAVQSAAEQTAEVAKSTFRPLQDAFDFEDVPGVDANDPLRMAFRSMDSLGETGDQFKRYLSNIIPGVHPNSASSLVGSKTCMRLLWPSAAEPVAFRTGYLLAQVRGLQPQVRRTCCAVDAKLTYVCGAWHVHHLGLQAVSQIPG